MTATATTLVPAAVAFDRLADDYDSFFTLSSIGKAQRQAVWKRLVSVFCPGGHILELNCGTGIDALFMVGAGLNVTACDASPRMIQNARRRLALEDCEAKVDFFTLSTEELRALPENRCFDGILSNFAGLNCVDDLGTFAREASRRLKPGSPLLLCLLSRFCLWETFYYMMRGKRSKALRRWKGAAEARIEQFSFAVNYPTLSELRRTFAPDFQLISTVGIGITVPPSFLDPWIASHPGLLRRMKAIDDVVRTWPGFRLIGDHMLLHLEKVRPC